MTCIVSYIDDVNKKIWMGGDSAGVSGLKLRIRQDSKVFIKQDVRKEHEFIIGYTSSFRMAQILRFSTVIPEIKDYVDIFEYMCTDFINSVRSSFKDGGFNTVDNGGDLGGTFIVGTDCGRVFTIDNDYQVGENISIYDSCGCGENYALGSLYQSSIGNITDSKTKVLSALECATYFSAGVAAPYTIKSIDIKQGVKC